MTFTTLTKLAWRAMSRSCVRTIMSGAGLVIGVLAITITVATGEGARRAVRGSFKAMFGSIDVLFVQPGGPAQRGMSTAADAITTLTPADAAAIAAQVSGVREVGMAQDASKIVAEANGQNTTTSLWGVSANWRSLHGDSVASGSYFEDTDARVAVLGSQVARTLRSSVGQRVRLSGVDFEVVGVLAPNGAGPGGISLDNIVYIPLGTASRRVFNRTALNLVDVALTKPDAWQATQGAVERVVRARHALAPGQIDDFRVIAPRAIIARMESVDSGLARTLWWVGALGLGLGGVIVAVLAVTAALQRRHEIATCRACGATRRDILLQFWAESVCTASAAAVLGALLGVGVTALGATMMRAKLAVDWPVTLGAVLATVLVGVLAGYVPARRAASVDPAIVLREAAP
jgi:ABC-type antimicrobial peptide transport system permease subunit